MHRIIKRLKRKLQKLLFFEQWSILVCDHDGKVLKHLLPPPARHWADPFPIEFEGHYYIFLEQQFKNKDGTLGFIELFEDLSYSEFKPILEKSHHLSFPYIFQAVAGEKIVWYMVPETHEHGSIDLYRASHFPEAWEFHSILIPNIEAVDTVIFPHAGKWWLFTSPKTPGKGLNEALCVFSSDDFPSAAWTPHPTNPVVSGLAGSRMAGRVIQDPASGLLLRPAQSCVKEYGERLFLKTISELSPGSYREETTRVVEPEKEFHAVCTHTWNLQGPYLLRDIKTRRFKLFAHRGKETGDR